MADEASAMLLRDALVPHHLKTEVLTGTKRYAMWLRIRRLILSWLRLLALRLITGNGCDRAG